MIRTAFFGTPAIAVPALEALASSTEVVGVVCQPDRPAGRGLKLAACAVKQAAERLGLPVHQPTKVKTGNLDEWLSGRGVEVAVVLAYGRILPERVLKAPRFGCLNLHASLLPKYRGAAPINWAIINGETETGISLMQMDVGLDTGPVFSIRRCPIAPEDTAAQVAEAIAELARLVILTDIPSVLAGDATATPQDHRAATHAPPLQPADSVVDFYASAEEIHNRVRGLAPKPGAFCFVNGKRLKLLEVRCSVWERPKDAEPGCIIACEKGLILVQTGTRPLEILRAQLEGRKALDAPQLVNGRVLRLSQNLEGRRS